MKSKHNKVISHKVQWKILTPSIATPKSSKNLSTPSPTIVPKSLSSSTSTNCPNHSLVDSSQVNIFLTGDATLGFGLLIIAVEAEEEEGEISGSGVVEVEAGAGAEVGVDLPGGREGEVSDISLVGLI